MSDHDTLTTAISCTALLHLDSHFEEVVVPFIAVCDLGPVVVKDFGVAM